MADDLEQRIQTALDLLKPQADGCGCDPDVDWICEPCFIHGVICDMKRERQDLQKLVKQNARLAKRHAAELNRRRGEMSVARDAMKQLGETEGSFYERIERLGIYKRAFESMANLATRAGISGVGVEVQAPLIDLSKAGIIKRGVELGLDYSITFSCYDPTEEGHSCGECDSCRFRHRGFLDAGVEDPTHYAAEPRIQ